MTHKEAYEYMHSVLNLPTVPAFYGEAPNGQKLPFTVYTMTSNNFNADNKVYKRGYDFRAVVYTANKDVDVETAMQQSFDDNCIPWEHDEEQMQDEKIYMQIYTGSFGG